MRHISPARLDAIEPLLEQLRAVGGLDERNRGTFYRKSRAFLHFHEDDEDVYADVRFTGDAFDRRRVTTKAEQAALVRDVRACAASRSS